MKKICVLGPGYIGLPTGAILASKGYKGKYSVNAVLLRAKQSGSRRL